MKIRKIDKGTLYTINWISLILLLVLIVGIIVYWTPFSLNSKAWGPISTFTGALFGALITGIVAIFINRSESRRRKKEISESIDKKVTILHLYSEEINECLSILKNAIESLDEIGDPFADYTNEEGQFIGNIPSPDQRDELEMQVWPHRNAICRSINRIIDILEEIKLVDIEVLRPGQFKRILCIKNHFNKHVEPLLKKNINEKIYYLNEKEVETLIKAFDEFHKIVSESRQSNH
ncbi:hypothetical protein KFZ58_15675 [Virgibacillus sp. NKC19-16]|uniref:hypothetical protein n=1 Tax=Virgibacillus salidurans TaxID=2831673 RepID=UPI001F3E7F2A|nr:hypothetical protein [Virgibacillus sp. NKC19-16]UJL45805.1 hypothetical protein KFZ58_15675 [Virgibacillus sp. NKC19-16]